MLEQLENRQLLAAQAMTTSVPFGAFHQFAALNTPLQVHVSRTGTLLVQGSTGADRISVSASKPSSASIVVTSITLSGQATVTTSDATGDGIYVSVGNGSDTVYYYFDPAKVKRISIDGGAGNDQIRIDPSVKLKCTLIGGKGNDTLQGGILGDTLSGGDGNDLLMAGPNQVQVTLVSPAKVVEPQPVGGKLFIPGTRKTIEPAKYQLITTTERPDSADLLEGGKGNDTLTGGAGPDTLDGGAGDDKITSSEIDAGDFSAGPDGSIIITGGGKISSAETIQASYQSASVINGVVFAKAPAAQWMFSSDLVGA